MAVRIFLLGTVHHGRSFAGKEEDWHLLWSYVSSVLKYKFATNWKVGFTIKQKLQEFAIIVEWQPIFN